MKTFTSVCAALLSLMALSACHNGNDPPEGGAQDPLSGTENENGIAGRGIVAHMQTAPDSRNDPGVGEVVFEDRDIRSFNIATREIVFNDMEPAEGIVPYRSIAFELDGETLFAAVAAVMPTSSRVIRDLVLYIERDNGYRYFLFDGYPLWAGRTEEGLANAVARAKGWNRFIEYLRNENKLIESGVNVTGDDPADNPDDPDQDEDSDGNIGDVELTVFTPVNTWKWVDMEPNRLNTVRSEEELQALISGESYSPSSIDFGQNTLLLVRVIAPYGLYRLYYGLTQSEEGYDYYLRVVMNCACVVTDQIFAVLAPAIPETADVSFEVEITDEDLDE